MQKKFARPWVLTEQDTGDSALAFLTGAEWTPTGQYPPPQEEAREFTETTLLNYVLGQMPKERETMPSQITEPKEKDK